jgi:phosphatidate cytidylyltransferase
MDSNLVRRVSFAAVAIPLALGVVWYGGWPLVLVVSLVSALGTRELYNLARQQGIEAASVYGMVTAAGIAPLVYLDGSTTGRLDGWILQHWPYFGALWIIGLLSWALARRSPTAKPLPAVAVTTFGVLYAGALPTFLIAIRHGQHGLKSWQGTWLVFFPLVVIWICDTAAMFGGRAMGGPKLAPSVSPGKTRSGALAGVAGGLLVVPIFASFFFRRTGLELSWPVLFGIAAVISVLGQVGDVAESLFKREAGVKDSSALIPGHGGVLDRFDSLYVAIPLTALGYRLFGII